MKEGLFLEDGELIYYKDGYPEHAGVVKIDGDIYYISSKGRAVKGEYIVHSEMTNGILKRGTYTFGEDCKLIKGSYIAPKKRKKKKNDTAPSKARKMKPATVALAVGAVLTVLAVLAFVILAEVLPSGQTVAPSVTTAPTVPTVPTTKPVSISLPTFEEEVLLCSESAKEVYDGELSIATAIKSGDPYRAMSFEYDLDGQSGILQLSENADLSNSREFILEADSSSLSIHNLKTGTTYYYKVSVDGQDYPGSFRTAASTRFLSVPGIANVRDIGGYVTADGKTVRQGLLIRGVEYDGLMVANYFIPNNAIEEVQKTFGFVYDMDLRDPIIYNGTYTPRLGEGVTHKFYNAPLYGQLFNSLQLSTVRSIFADLANPANYPMYMHCTWGTDRTGTVIYLLQGVLGMSEEDMVREYQLSAYSRPNILDSTGIEAIHHGLESCDGDTVQEKIVNYLTQVAGVTEAELNTIRSIFLSE